DFLVAFENDDCRPWMSRRTEVEEALAALLKRDVDVVYKPGIEQSRNRLRGDAILASAQVIYGA
ncbi:MAG: nucleotidyltransferase, partial [Phycisphaerae bacterium]